MDSFSKYLASKIINHLLRNQAFTPPTTVYLALFKSSVGLENNSSVTGEVTGTAYSRQALTLDAAVAAVTNNSSDVVWTEAGSDWGVITHIAIVDHATNTNWGTNVNVLMYGELGESKNVVSGTTVKLLAGQLSITIQ